MSRSNSGNKQERRFESEEDEEEEENDGFVRVERDTYDEEEEDDDGDQFNLNTDNAGSRRDHDEFGNEVDDNDDDALMQRPESPGTDYGSENNNNGRSRGNSNNITSTDELRELFKMIHRYNTQDIEIEAVLKPFIPDYLPAVGDIDAFIKVRRNKQTDLISKLRSCKS